MLRTHRVGSRGNKQEALLSASLTLQLRRGLPWGPRAVRASKAHRLSTALFVTCSCERIVHRLTMKLQHVRARNGLLVKLVDQENLAAEYDSSYCTYEDAREQPNISISHVIFNGHHISLPDGVELSC